MPQTDTMEDNTKFKDGVNRNARLIVRNISFKATEEVLREHFTPYGNVEEVKLLKRPDGKLVGCGFVHYTHVPMASKALTATNRKPFLGRPINVAWAVAKDKYTEKLNENQPKKRKSNGSGVLADDDEPEVTEVKKDSPNKKGPKEDDKKKERLNRNARLVVRNVSFKATEDSLKEHFQSYGDIIEVKLLKKPDGKLVGCAFVHFKNVPMAKKALLNTNMKPFLGRPISVDWAVAKDKYMQYVVGKQLELQNDVKKEDSDDEEDGHQPLNISNDDLKAEVKSESEDESGKEDGKSEDEDSDASAASDDDDDDDSDGDEGEDEDDEPNEDDIDMEDDDKSETESTVPERKRIKLNDAEDGCTVFLTNIPFSVDNEQLQQFAEKTGSVRYALVCVDKLTEHSKGSGFIKFMTKEEADKFLSLPPSSLRLDGQAMVAKPALKRESLQSTGSKQPKDNRNLYLVKEGVVVAGTKAALGVSASDMAKRLALEKSKTQMLKNLNRFVSRYRLVVSNLPPTCTDATLRASCARAAGRTASVTEARVMRDLRAPTQRDGKQPTKGYGFVMFTRHEDALQCLRKLNNNPDIFDPKNRPIVSFSIEDRTALNARKKRLEKSIANNPQQNNAAENTEEEDSKNKGYRKRKGMEKPDESKFKRGKFDRNDNRGNKQDGGDQGDRNQQNGRSNKQGSNQNDGNQQNGRWNKQGGNQNDGNQQNGRWNKQGGYQNDGNQQNGRWNKQGGNPNDGKQQNGRWNKQDGGNQNDGNQDGGRNRKGGNQNNGWKQNNPGKFVRPNNDDELGDYTGITAREGSKHNMRSNQKLRAQADLHRQSVKAEKKTSQRAMRLKMAAKERVKQPKQKVNKNPKKGNNSITERKVNAAIKESSTFSDLVSKYKSKLAGNSLDRVKAKWYEA